MEYITQGVASENAKADLLSATALIKACRRIVDGVVDYEQMGSKLYEEAVTCQGDAGREPGQPYVTTHICAYTPLLHNYAGKPADLDQRWRKWALKLSQTVSSATTTATFLLCSPNRG